jgi:hypothetical protein
MAKKHGLASVYPLYVDSIHGFALSKEGPAGGGQLPKLPRIASHPEPQES